MQITDPIADMLTRIRNAGSARHETVDVPASKMKKAIAEILLEEGYIRSFQLIDDGTQGIIRITLKYLPGKEKAIQGLKRVSKPGLRPARPRHRHHFDFQGHHDRQEGPRGPCRRRSPCVCLVRRVRDMSRIGREPITVPAGVEVTIAPENVVTVKGPKGTITEALCPDMVITEENGVLHVARKSDTKQQRSLHGLTRSLLHNMVVGVTQGFEKKLEINGVGYRAEKKGEELVMKLGYSHDVIVKETADIKIDVTDANHIVIKGIDKQKVGQFAADVRNKRPPEPYKGKGIKYEDEHIRRKEGKTGAK